MTALVGVFDEPLQRVLGTLDEDADLRLCRPAPAARGAFGFSALARFFRGCAAVDETERITATDGGFLTRRIERDGRAYDAAEIEPLRLPCPALFRPLAGLARRFLAEAVAAPALISS